MQINERLVSVALLLPAQVLVLGGWREQKEETSVLITRVLITYVKLQAKEMLS